MSASTQQNAAIWNDLHALGLNDIAAAGVMGNMSQESSMNPNEPGGGLMQWIGSRWTALVSYAHSKGLDPNSETAQVGWFGQELKAGNEGITLSGLNSQPSPQAAALYVSQKYERPSQPNNPNREAQAANFYNEFSGKKVSGGSDPSLINLSSAPSQSGNQVTPPSAFAQGSDIIQMLDNDLKLQGFDIKNPGQSIAQDAKAISLRVVLVLLGLIFVIFALVEVVEKSTGGAVPIPV